MSTLDITNQSKYSTDVKGSLKLSEEVKYVDSSSASGSRWPDVYTSAFQTPRTISNCRKKTKKSSQKFKKNIKKNFKKSNQKLNKDAKKNTEKSDQKLNKDAKKNTEKSDQKSNSNIIIPLKIIKSRLKEAFDFVEFFKKSVTEQINLTNIEKNECVSEKYPNSQCDLADIKVSMDSDSRTDLVNNELEMKTSSPVQNELAEHIDNLNLSTKNNLINGSLSIKNEELNVLSNDLGYSSADPHNVDARTVVNNCPFENVIVSLISDDDSDNDCTLISLSCPTSTSVTSENISESCTVHNEPVSVKSETLITNIEKFSDCSDQEKGGINDQTEKVPNDLSLSTVGINNSSPTVGMINSSPTTKKNYKLNKRKLSDSDKYHSKKKNREISLRKNNDNDSPKFVFVGEFYKVKLSNLHSSTSYMDIASLLQKSGLNYIDILLINNGQKSFAEVSFTNATAREKAVSLDKSLSLMGMKMKIRPI